MGFIEGIAIDVSANAPEQDEIVLPEPGFSVINAAKSGPVNSAKYATLALDLGRLTTEPAGNTVGNTTESTDVPAANELVALQHSIIREIAEFYHEDIVSVKDAEGAMKFYYKRIGASGEAEYVLLGNVNEAEQKAIGGLLEDLKVSANIDVQKALVDLQAEEAALKQQVLAGQQPAGVEGTVGATGASGAEQPVQAATTPGFWESMMSGDFSGAAYNLLGGPLTMLDKGKGMVVKALQSNMAKGTIIGSFAVMLVKGVDMLGQALGSYAPWLGERAKTFVSDINNAVPDLNLGSDAEKSDVPAVLTANYPENLKKSSDALSQSTSLTTRGFILGAVSEGAPVESLATITGISDYDALLSQYTAYINNTQRSPEQFTGCMKNVLTKIDIASGTDAPLAQYISPRSDLHDTIAAIASYRSTNGSEKLAAVGNVFELVVDDRRQGPTVTIDNVTYKAYPEGGIVQGTIDFYADMTSKIKDQNPPIESEQLLSLYYPGNTNQDEREAIQAIINTNTPPVV